MPTERVHLAPVELPDFGVLERMPEIPASLYVDRLSRLRERAACAGHDTIVIYADREHSANLAYLSGFDPRFEEAMMVVGPGREPAILVGNECWGMAGVAPLALNRQSSNWPGSSTPRVSPPRTSSTS